MGFVKCFDVVMMVAEEATKQFGSLLCVDEDKERLLESYCEILDSIAKRFNGVSFDVEVDDETTDITVSLVCDEFEIDEHSDEFYSLVSKTKKINIKACDSDKIQIDFTFGGIWVKSY